MYALLLLMISSAKALGLIDGPPEEPVSSAVATIETAESLPTVNEFATLLLQQPFGNYVLLCSGALIVSALTLAFVLVSPSHMKKYGREAIALAIFVLSCFTLFSVFAILAQLI